MCVATRPAITPLFPAVFPTRYLTPEESSPSILAPRRGTGMWLFNGSPEQEAAMVKPGPWVHKVFTALELRSADDGRRTIEPLRGRRVQRRPLHLDRRG